MFLTEKVFLTTLQRAKYFAALCPGVTENPMPESQIPAKMQAFQSFFMSEVEELREAMKKQDNAEIFDAIIDASYFCITTYYAIYGAKAQPIEVEEFLAKRDSDSLTSFLLETGLVVNGRKTPKHAIIYGLWACRNSLFNLLPFLPAQAFIDGFDLVHRANMKKFMKPKKLAKTIEAYRLKDIEVVAYETQKPGLWRVQRLQDGKVLKPYDWQPPDLKRFIK